MITDTQQRLLTMLANGRYLNGPQGGVRSAPNQRDVESLVAHGLVTVENDDYARGTIAVTSTGRASAR